MKKLRHYSETISNDDLIIFLNKIADSIDSPIYGNKAMAFALRVLAKDLAIDEISEKDKKLKENSLVNNEFKDMTIDDVCLFLSKKNTKVALIDFARSRFDIPSSSLKRMNLNEIKQTIETALQHEKSIRIISIEAQGSGKDRTS